MKFDLTLTTVLVFFVPGALFMMGAPTPVVSWLDSWQIWQRPRTATDGALVLSAIFLCGALADCVRTVTIQRLVQVITEKVLKSEVSTAYFRLLSDKSLPVFSMLIDRAFEYLRLNENIATVLASLFILRSYLMAKGLCVPHGFSLWIGSLCLTVGWLFIAAWSQRSLNTALAGFVTAQENKGSS